MLQRDTTAGSLQNLKRSNYLNMFVMAAKILQKQDITNANSLSMLYARSCKYGYIVLIYFATK